MRVRIATRFLFFMSSCTVFQWMHANTRTHPPLYNQDIFCPVLPLLEDRPALAITDASATGADSAAKVLSQQDFDAFQTEHRRTLDAKLKTITANFPTGSEADTLLISAVEATTRLLMSQMQEIVSKHKDAVGYIEYMLYSQLEAAVGKVVRAKDFNEFMAYHNKRLFLSAYTPRPFCYSIRRPDHYPEGLVALEQASDDASGGYAPLPTMTCCLADGAFPVPHRSPYLTLPP